MLANLSKMIDKGISGSAIENSIYSNTNKHRFTHFSSQKIPSSLCVRPENKEHWFIFAFRRSQD